MTQDEVNKILESIEAELVMSKGLGFTLRKPQVEAIKAYLQNTQGLFELTCGSGKTLIQACIIMLELQRAIREGRQFRGLFVCHRLMLEEQVKREYLSYFGQFFQQAGLEIRTLNSTGDDSFRHVADRGMQSAFGEHVLYMTTTASVGEYVDKHTGKFKNGCDELAKCIKGLDLYIHDESHKELPVDILDTIRKATRCSKAYFFTATPSKILTTRLTTLYRYTFAQGVKDGIIVKPVFYPVKTATAKLDDNAAAGITIAAYKHLARYKLDTDGHRETAGLVGFFDSVDRVYAVGRILNGYKASHPRFNPNVYEIVSDKTLTDSNGQSVKACIRLNGKEYNDEMKAYSKQKILEILRADSRPKVILSAFMISEGIDLPDLNGVLIACEKTDASLYQSICRGCRASTGKENFFLYNPTVDGLDQRMDDFLSELVKFTDSQFDFGGLVQEDQNDGSDGDSEDDESSGVGAMQQPIYKQIQLSIRRKKTEFDALKVERDQVEEFNGEISGVKTMPEMMRIMMKYTRLWKDKPELLTANCGLEKMLDCQKRFW